MTQTAAGAGSIGESSRDTQYVDPRLIALYDRLNSADHDFRSYEARIGEPAKRVLDLGCGTGLFALRLARLGHHVMGLDPAPAMIAWARTQDAARHVDWVVGQVSDLPVDARFDVVVMTGHAFQCLTTLSAVIETMKDVRSRLAAGGRFMFESRNPRRLAWEQWTPEALAIVHDAAGAEVRVFPEVTLVSGATVTFRTHFVFPDAEHISETQLLFLSRAEIERCLTDAGFEQVAICGDWDGFTMTDESPEIIVIAQ